MEKNFKLNPEITLLICNVVEQMVGKDVKIDKKALVLKALAEVFALNEDEVRQADDQVEFLFNNGDIRKVPLLKAVKRGISSFFLRKK